MTEEDAKAWLNGNVPRETFGRLASFVEMLREEGQSQNLIARSTLDQIWLRHVVDSAQLAALAPSGRWMDIGSGAGFPGVIVAILENREIALVEPRARRAEYLNRVIAALDLSRRVTVVVSPVERFAPDTPFAVASARAVTALDQLFAMGQASTSPATTWILPKGRSAQAELAAARQAWHGDFTIVPSITDADAGIVVARNIRPRKPR